MKEYTVVVVGMADFDTLEKRLNELAKDDWVIKCELNSGLIIMERNSQLMKCPPCPK